ncbi:paREP13 [Pyrobaculum aerophilum str. IM2]|uniref:PaREP13 n=1 Tax=Pyrobaculum aerophilum (strain ATCC 51768 / DSM 7523 / JCM 9630 / CIP 104966 / NBRC 100827 / IM2) TaxID=178306 RepID=Q8ZWE2_PYRAE|nr:paREP13 [Pyrobaculum aerophilum str. IM2]
MGDVQERVMREPLPPTPPRAGRGGPGARAEGGESPPRGLPTPRARPAPEASGDPGPRVPRGARGDRGHSPAWLQYHRGKIKNQHVDGFAISTHGKSGSWYLDKSSKAIAGAAIITSAIFVDMNSRDFLKILPFSPSRARHMSALVLVITSLTTSVYIRLFLSTRPRPWPF